MSVAALINIILGSLLASKGHDKYHDEGGVVREHDKVMGVHNAAPIHGAVPIIPLSATPATRREDHHIV